MGHLTFDISEIPPSFHRSLPEQFHTKHGPPLRRAEIVDDTVTDAKLESQMGAVADSFQPSGQESFHPRLPAEERVKGRFTENLRSGNDSPTAIDGNPPARARSEQKFAAIRTAGYGRLIEWTHVNANMTSI